jgi:hypothetical protein
VCHRGLRLTRAPSGDLVPVRLRQTIGTAAAVAVVATTPAPSATVVVSTSRAGARPVATTVRLRYEMQCGWPGPGPLTIQLPAAMSMPLLIPPSAILIDGKPAKRVRMIGHWVLLALPRRPQVLCDVLAPGTVTITFTRAAGLGNPSTPGTYRLRAAEASLTFLATLTIRPR